MPIESYKRFWQLSLIPTHSKESLNELHEYVRRAIIREIVLSDGGGNLCGYCANKECAMREMDLNHEEQMAMIERGTFDRIDFSEDDENDPD